MDHATTPLGKGRETGREKKKETGGSILAPMSFKMQEGEDLIQLSSAKKWDKMFAQLKEFHGANGHCIVRMLGVEAADRCKGR
jgi:hypothetical protein